LAIWDHEKDNETEYLGRIVGEIIIAVRYKKIKAAAAARLAVNVKYYHLETRLAAIGLCQGLRFKKLVK
jgi:hypothetical protein